MEKLDQEEALGRMAGPSPINLFQTYAVLSPCYTVKWHIRRSRNKATVFFWKSLVFITCKI